MLEVILFNGAEDPEVWKEDSEKFINAIKPCTRKFICKTFQLTYDVELSLFNVHVDGAIIPSIELGMDEGYWQIHGKFSDGIFYGSVSIQAIEE